MLAVTKLMTPCLNVKLEAALASESPPFSQWGQSLGMVQTKHGDRLYLVQAFEVMISRARSIS